MNIQTIEDLFLEQIQDLYDAEGRLVSLVTRRDLVKNLSFPDAVLGSDRQWVFLFCGSCGTTFDVEPGTR